MKCDRRCCGKEIKEDDISGVIITCECKDKINKIYVQCRLCNECAKELENFLGDNKKMKEFLNKEPKKIKKMSRKNMSDFVNDYYEQFHDGELSD